LAAAREGASVAGGDGDDNGDGGGMVGGAGVHSSSESRMAAEDESDAAAVAGAVGALAIWASPAGASHGSARRPPRPLALGVQWPAAIVRAAVAEPGRVAAALAAAPIRREDLRLGLGLGLGITEGPRSTSSSSSAPGPGPGLGRDRDMDRDMDRDRDRDRGAVRVTLPPPDGAVALLPVGFPRAALKDPE